MLETISSAQHAPQLDAFRQRLQQLGYVEGINFVIEYRSAEGRGDRFPPLVAELIQRNVDLLVLRGTTACREECHFDNPRRHDSGGRSAFCCCECVASRWALDSLDTL